MQIKRLILILSILCLAVMPRIVSAQTIPEEARRHMARGQAAVEMAKSAGNYALAVKEFEQAARLAPDWADAYYNLGMVQGKAGKYSDAIISLRQYLRLAPNATDAKTVKGLIYKLEYKKEQEDGVKRVYERMTYSTNISAVPHVNWKLINKKGDNEVDWEIEHNNDYDSFKVPKDPVRNKMAFSHTW